MKNNDDTTHLIDETLIPKGQPFLSPVGYFEGLPTIIQRRIEGKDCEIRNTGFNEPEKYFATLPDRIILKVTTEEKEQNPVKQIGFINWTWVASVAATVVLTWGIINDQQNTLIKSNLTKQQWHIDNLSSTEIASILNKSDISEEELIKNISITRLNQQIEISSKEENEIINQLEETDITSEL